MSQSLYVTRTNSEAVSAPTKAKNKNETRSLMELTEGEPVTTEFGEVEVENIVLRV